MKKVIRVLLALALVITCISAVSMQTKAATVSGYCGVDFENLTWSLDNAGTLTISGTGAMQDYTDDYYVFYAPWHGYRNEIKKVVIQSGVTNISRRAFYECEKVTSVTIPNTVKTIGEKAFYECKSLTSITIPDSVTTIGDLAFAWCNKLTTVNIGKGLASVGELAFDGCRSLEKFAVNKNNASFSNDDRGVLFDKKKTILLRAPETISGSYTIPNGVKTIGEWAISSCDNLTTVKIPGSVITVGNGAFALCRNLTSVKIPDSVITIGDNAFDWCENMTSVTIGNGVTTIGKYAFFECAGLTSVTIPDSVITIGKDAFMDCYGLTSVTIGNGVTTIGEWAFAYCDLTAVTMGDGVTTIGEAAFIGCDNLANVYYTGSQTQWQAINIGPENTLLTNAAIHYNQFPDVKTNAWYYNAVQFAVEKGYFSGHDSGVFKPSDPITRQDFVLVLSRIAGADLTGYTGETAFTDVKPNAYYAKAIQWATENGIIGGYNATTFGVGDKLTREQLVTIMYRYAKKLGVDVTVTTGWDLMNEYPDATAPNPNLREMVAWALEKGIISGKQVNGKTCIAPQASATRAETAQILLNISTKGLIPGI